MQRGVKNSASRTRRPASFRRAVFYWQPSPILHRNEGLWKSTRLRGDHRESDGSAGASPKTYPRLMPATSWMSRRSRFFIRLSLTDGTVKCRPLRLHNSADGTPTACRTGFPFPVVDAMPAPVAAGAIEHVSVGSVAQCRPLVENRVLKNLHRSSAQTGDSGSTQS